MDPKNEFEPIPSPQELMALASAIAAREQKELATLRAAMEGVEASSDTIVDHEALVDGTVRNLLQLESSGDQTYLLGMLDQEFRQKYQVIADMMSAQEGRPVSLEEARELTLNRAMDIMTTLGQTEEQSTKDFQDLLIGARTVAKQHEVSIANVYESDELFAEANRETYTAQEFALRFVDMLSGITVQSMTQLLLSSVSRATIKQGVDVDQYLREVSLQPRFRNTVVTTVLKNRQDLQEFAKVQLIRIWGKDELLALPDDIKRKLAI